MSGGQVTAQQGIAAVQQAILQTLGTQKLGQFATGAAGSLAGQLSNRDEALDILLKSSRAKPLPAVKAYKPLSPTRRRSLPRRQKPAGAL